MTRSIAIARVMMLALLVMAGPAAAQEQPGPGKLEVTLIPAGATFFAATDHGPNFNNFDIGASGTYNFTRTVGVEGEVAGSFGLKQNLSDVLRDVDTPNMVSYSGNVVVGMTQSAFVPYATVGVGGLTVYDSRDLGLDNNLGTFFTGNAGAGLKWYQGSGRWGLRGDYRIQFVRSKDDAPSFFGQDTRWGNRIYGGVILNVVK